MRKYLLGYPVWAARKDMLEWLMMGIKENFDPARVEVAFYMDQWTRGDRDAFKRWAGEVLPEFNVSVDGGTHVIYEMGCHNFFIGEMIDRGLDCLIAPQDDLRFEDPNVLANLDRVLGQYGTNIGYIGMREGYGYGLQHMMASPFDAKIAGPPPVEEIPVGEWRECVMVNPGPLVYPRSTVMRIGGLDVMYHNWHWWNDYALKARAAGLNNGLLSINAKHEKIGEYRAGTLVGDDEGWEPKDRANLNARWTPSVGHKVY